MRLLKYKYYLNFIDLLDFSSFFVAFMNFRFIEFILNLNRSECTLWLFLKGTSEIKVYFVFLSSLFDLLFALFLGMFTNNFSIKILVCIDKVIFYDFSRHCSNS